jgi:hypothetical protein
MLIKQKQTPRWWPQQHKEAKKLQMDANRLTGCFPYKPLLNLINRYILTVSNETNVTSSFVIVSFLRKSHVESVLEFADNGVALWPRFLVSLISVTFLISTPEESFLLYRDIFGAKKEYQTRRTYTCLIKFMDEVKNVEA